MHYRHLTMAAAVVATMTATARQRTSMEIQEAATQVLGGGIRHLKGQGTAAASALNILRRCEQLTIVGRRDGHGFALVANDDEFLPIVGYSEEAYNAANPALEWYIQAASQAMSAQVEGRHHGRTPVDATGKMATSVEPMIQTLWHQSTPYNDLCPLNASGKPYPTGCVSTALSQLMFYHRYPTHGQGVKQYSFKADDRIGDVIEVDFGATTYEWDNMLLEYDKNSTDEQRQAVATLMLHTGVSVEMTYNSTGSGAYPSAAREGLIRHFAYNANIELLERPFYSAGEWMRLVYTELSAGRPILYGGSDKSYGGHAFILDGYDADGLVHVNWGWGPDSGNGYYDIDLLDPTHYQFTESQHMLLGLTPDTQGEFRSHVVSSNPFTARRLTKAMLSVTKDSQTYNNTGEVLSGQLGLLLQPMDNAAADDEPIVLQTCDFTGAPDRFYFSDNVGGAIALPQHLNAGTYRLYVAVKSTRDARWQPVRRPAGSVNSYFLHHTGSDYSLSADTSDSWAASPSADAIHDLQQSASTASRAAVQVYDIQGRRIQTTPASHPDHGLFIIREGTATRKILSSQLK